MKEIDSSSDSEHSKNEDDTESYDSDSVKDEEKEDEYKEDEEDEIINEDEEIRKEEEKRKEEELEDEEEDIEEEEDDEDDFQKLPFTDDLEKLHPDTHVCNNDEVMALSKVVRNSKGVICDPMHTTLPFITKYEKARMIGARAEQIDRGALPLVNVEPDVINGRIIAQMEFEQKKIPFIIARPLPNGKIEYWRMSDLEILV